MNDYLDVCDDGEFGDRDCQAAELAMDMLATNETREEKAQRVVTEFGCDILYAFMMVDLETDPDDKSHRSLAEQWGVSVDDIRGLRAWPREKRLAVVEFLLRNTSE